MNPSIDGGADFVNQGTDAKIYKKLTSGNKFLNASVSVNPKTQVLIPGEYTMILHAAVDF